MFVQTFDAPGPQPRTTIKCPMTTQYVRAGERQKNWSCLHNLEHLCAMHPSNIPPGRYGRPQGEHLQWKSVYRRVEKYLITGWECYWMLRKTGSVDILIYKKNNVIFSHTVCGKTNSLYNLGESLICIWQVAYNHMHVLHGHYMPINEYNHLEGVYESSMCQWCCVFLFGHWKDYAMLIRKCDLWPWAAFSCRLSQIQTF